MSSTAAPESSTSSPASSGDRTEALGNYRSLSVLALLALAMGLLAPLAFSAPLLLAVPVLGVAVALLSLGKIAASDGQMIGRKAALVGLTLSVVCLAGALTRDWMALRLVGRQAQVAGLQWINLLLANRPQAALAMTPEGQPRPPAPSSPMGPSEPEESPFELFVAEPLVQALTELGEGAEAEFLAQSACVRVDAYRHLVEQQFAVTSGGQTIVVNLGLERRRVRDAAPRWLIRNRESDDLPTKIN